jgi:4a-hydroxytetrahydrobiopterin dehydratase
MRMREGKMPGACQLPWKRVKPLSQHCDLCVSVVKNFSPQRHRGTEPKTQTQMWTEKDNKLERSFRFKDFAQAFSFMTQVAFIAERMNHHPAWTNVWNRVDISLSTHDAGDVVTEKDRKLAAAIDTVYAGFVQ